MQYGVEMFVAQGTGTYLENIQQQLVDQEKKLKLLESKLKQERQAKANLQADFEHVISQLTKLKRRDESPSCSSIVV